MTLRGFVKKSRSYYKFNPGETAAVFQMEGNTRTWSEILQDPDYKRFADEFPSIYTNHWLSKADEKFKQLQMPYMAEHVNRIVELLKLDETDVFIDLTDNDHSIAAAIRDQIKFNENTFCIGKPFKQLAECVVQHPSLVPLYSESTLVAQDMSHFEVFHINKVLITAETIANNNNHITDLLKTLSKNLPEDWRILIVYRPEHTYLPLFEGARQEMIKTQLSTDDLRKQIRAAGLDKISIELHHYQTEVEYETWLAMLRSRHFSFLRNLRAEEVEDGIEFEIEPKYSDMDKISFKDSFVYLTVLPTS